MKGRESLRERMFEILASRKKGGKEGKGRGKEGVGGGKEGVREEGKEGRGEGGGERKG